jgi:uncharacterized protein (TIGR01615 family)
MIPMAMEVMRAQSPPLPSPEATLVLCSTIQTLLPDCAVFAGADSLDSVLVVQAGPVRHYVDLLWRSRFRVARETPEYQRYVEESIPEVFVGTESALVAALEQHCAALERCFDASRLRLPPWRQAPYLVSQYRAVASSADTGLLEDLPPTTETPPPSSPCAAAADERSQLTLEVALWKRQEQARRQARQAPLCTPPGFGWWGTTLPCPILPSRRAWAGGASPPKVSREMPRGARCVKDRRLPSPE